MTTEQAKQLLRDAGYYVDNLWHIDDVMGRFECNEQEAQEVLNGALTNSHVMETIHYVIEAYASDDYKRKEVTNDNKTKLVRVIDTWGLDEDTISKIEEVMMYTNDYIENDTLFVELHNSKNEVIRIFPERIQEIRKEVSND